jgi:GNAT superfamily N-acetyltransferase
MSWQVRPASDDDREFAAIADLVTRVTPEDPSSVEEMRWSDATYPGGLRLVAEIDGRIVGAASVGRIYMYPPEFERFYLTAVVLPDHRRNGIGSAFLAAVSEHARGAGKTGLQTDVSEAQADGIAFLEHRGFTEIERAKSVRLELDGLAPPPLDPPAGIVLVTLAERPELVPGIHAVARLAFPDIPGGGEPIEAGDLDEFRARDVERPGIPAAAFQVALDDASGEVVGYASLQLIPGSDTVAWHDMTAVHPAYRGRGIATALKWRTVAWAMTAGLRALETGNDVDNAPMRAVNARLGYSPLPDTVSLRGPLVGGMMTR